MQGKIVFSLLAMRCLIFFQKKTVENIPLPLCPCETEMSFSWKARSVKTREILRILNIVIVRPDAAWRGGCSLVADACKRDQQRLRRHKEHEAHNGQRGEV